MTLSYFSSGLGHGFDLVICLVEGVGWLSLIVVSLVIYYLLCECHTPEMVFIKNATKFGMVIGTFFLIGTSLIAVKCLVILIVNNRSPKRIGRRN